MLPTPINECVLVELTSALDYVDVPDKQYTTKTSGIVVAVPPSYTGYSPSGKTIPIKVVDVVPQQLLGKRVYFKDYEDGTQIEVDGKSMAFIEYEKIRGFSE